MKSVASISLLKFLAVTAVVLSIALFHDQCPDFSSLSDDTFTSECSLPSKARISSAMDGVPAPYLLLSCTLLSGFLLRTETPSGFSILWAFNHPSRSPPAIA